MTHASGIRPGSLRFFAAHELRLSARDMVGMITAGKPQRLRNAAIFAVALTAFLHFVAWITLPTETGDKDPFAHLVTLTAVMVLPLALMLSQAMESITRVFYTRSDLDLVLASPVPPQIPFAVRIGAVSLSISLLSLFLGAAFINVLAVRDSMAWLACYPVLLATGVFATLFSLALTMAMFRVIGARRTRLIAQIVAAVVGATFIIGVQLAAIASMGTISRMTFLTSDLVQPWLPAETSWFWIPARAATGEMLPLLVYCGLAALAFLAATAMLARPFADNVIAAAGADAARGPRQTRQRAFRSRSIRSALRHKEWKLLLRDHWLISQTLMQVFYLVPPAFMLWRGFGQASDPILIVVPILVMAAGQLAGGLAWLAISGEDAPQLVATAPVTPQTVIRAKIEAVLSGMAIVVSPILLLMAIHNPAAALVCAAGIAISSVSATIIQLWFRSQARRSNFRRRQTSSKVATFAEAFSSIFWAGATGLAAAGSMFAILFAVAALVVMAIVRYAAPPPAEQFA